MKNWLLAFVCLLAPAFAQGQGIPYQLNPPAPNARVLFCPVPDGGYPCPTQTTVYSDSAATQSIAQPISLGSSGNLSIYFAPGTASVTVQFIGTGYGPQNRVVITLSSGGASINNLFAADTGSGANVYVTAPPVHSLTNLQQTYFTVAHNNTGPSTLNEGDGVKNLTKLGTTALASGDLITGVTYYAIYDGTEWVVQNPSGGGGVTSVQYGLNAALTGAIIESFGLGFASPSQSGQTVTIAANQASPVLAGVSTLSGVGGATYIPCGTLQKAETGTADANVLTCAPSAAAGLYRLSVNVSVSAATAGVVGWTATWTDSNGNAQAPVELELFQNATAAPALTFTTSAAGDYHGSAMIDVNNAGTNIVIKWIGGGTTTAKMSATVERIL